MNNILILNRKANYCPVLSSFWEGDPFVTHVKTGGGGGGGNEVEMRNNCLISTLVFLAIVIMVATI